MFGADSLYQAQAPLQNSYGSAFGPQYEETAAGMMAGGVNAAALGGSIGLFMGPMMLPGALGRGVDDLISPVSMRNGRFGMGALGRAGRSLGRGFGGALTLGSRLGMSAGAFTGAALGVAAPIAGMIAMEQGITATASNIIEGQQEFLATRQLMRSFGGSPQSVLSPGVGVPGAPGVSQFQNNMTSIGAQYGMSSGQTRNLFGQMQAGGQIDTSSVQRASQSFRQSLQELREISNIIGADIQEAQQVYQAMDQMGVQGRGNRAGILRGVTSTSLLTGRSLNDVMTYSAAGSQAFGSRNMNAASGARFGMDVLANTSMLANNGMLPGSYLAARGGVDGVAQRMMEYQLGFAGSEGGQRMMSQLFDPSGSVRMSSDVFSGEEARYSSQFFRDMDPYRMAGMQERMTRMQGDLVLSRVSNIRRSADSPGAANREQYEFLQSLGISDPEDQLTYLQSLQNRGSTQTLQALQGSRDSVVTAFGDRTNQLRDRSRAFQDALRDIVDSVTTDLQNLGGALQVASEQYTRDMQQGMFGRSRTYATDMFTAENFNAGRQQFLRGEMVGRGAFMPLRGLEETIAGSSTLQSAIANSANMTGNFRRTTPGLSGGSRFLQDVFVRAPIRAREIGNELMGDLYRGALNGGDFNIDVRRGLGGGYSDRFFTADANDPGAFSVGRGRYATAGMVMQAMSSDFGRIYDIESGTFSTADSAAVRSISRRFGQGLERQIGASITSGQSDRERRGFLGIRGAINDFRGTQGMETQPLLSNSLMRQLDTGQMGAGIRDELAQQFFGRSFEELNPTQQATLLTVISQEGGQYGRSLSQNFQTGEGVSEAAMAAMGGATVRNMVLGASFGIGDDGYSAVDQTRNGTINTSGLGLQYRSYTGDHGAGISATAGGIAGLVNVGNFGNINTGFGSRGHIMQNVGGANGTGLLFADGSRSMSAQRQFAADASRILRRTQIMAENIGFDTQGMFETGENGMITSINIGAVGSALDRIGEQGSDRQVRRAAELRNELNALQEASMDRGRFIEPEMVRDGALGLLAPSTSRGRAQYDIQEVNGRTTPILQGRLRAAELYSSAGGRTGRYDRALSNLVGQVAAGGLSDGDAAAAYELMAMSSGTAGFDSEAQLRAAAQRAGVDFGQISGFVASVGDIATERRTGVYADSDSAIQGRRATFQESRRYHGDAQMAAQARTILNDVGSLNRGVEAAVFAEARNQEARTQLSMLEREAGPAATQMLLSALGEGGYSTEAISSRLSDGENIFEVLRGSSGARDTLRSQISAMRSAGQGAQADELERYMMITTADGDDNQAYQRLARLATTNALRGGQFNAGALMEAGYSNVGVYSQIFDEDVSAADAGSMLSRYVGGQDTLNQLMAQTGFQEGLTAEELVERLRTGAAGGEGSAATFDLVSQILAGGGQVQTSERATQQDQQNFRDQVLEHLGKLVETIDDNAIRTTMEEAAP